jgi:hypothetical protein
MPPKPASRRARDLIDRWDRERQASPDASRIILTHTNDEVRALNEAARDRMRDAGEPWRDVRITVERGERSFASGDRVMFLQNERGLGVKNGTLGTVEQVSAQSMSVRTDDGRSRRVRPEGLNRIDHGYAATIHKAQGMTVDRTHVLATPGMDAHGSYVALSRHRDGMDLHYGRDDFARQNRLVRTLSRDRAKDMASDYEPPPTSYAERRGITFRERVERVVEIVKQVVPEKVRGMFDGLRLPARPATTPERAGARTGGAGKREGGRPGGGVAQAPATGRSCAMPAPWTRSSRCRSKGQGQPGAGDGTAARPAKPSRRCGRTAGTMPKPPTSQEPGACRGSGWWPARSRHPRPPARNRNPHRGTPIWPQSRSGRRADRFVERWQKLDRDQPAPVCRRATYVRLQGHAGARWATWRTA